MSIYDIYYVYFLYKMYDMICIIWIIMFTLIIFGIILFLSRRQNIDDDDFSK